MTARRRPLTPAAMLAGEKHALFFSLLRRERLPIPTPEYRFDDVREWRFDYAFVAHRVALEVEGGVWTRGRHTRGAGYVRDLEKYNRAAALGWRLLRVTPDQLCDLLTVRLIRDTLTPAP